MTTIAYLADARPSKYGQSGIDELTKDINQIISQSPTDTVDAIVFVGDMDRISQTMQAYNASNVKNIPFYFTVGNHEAENSSDMTALRNFYVNYEGIKYPGPDGSSTTTYSIDINNIHLCIINEYWDGASNDAYFKYRGEDGGYIPQKLYDWINNDLTSSTKPWKIVTGHEPLYPYKNHVGNSLDRDIANRDKLQNLFVNKKVPVFVGGHTHYSGITLHDTVYHANCGNCGGQAGGSGKDDFASIIYTHTDQSNTLILTWVYENPTWDTSKIVTYTIIQCNPPQCNIIISQ